MIRFRQELALVQLDFSLDDHLAHNDNLNVDVIIAITRGAEGQESASFFNLNSSWDFFAISNEGTVHSFLSICLGEYQVLSTKENPRFLAII